MAVAMVGKSQVSITVDAATKPYPISPFIYGKNNSTSFRPDDPTPESRWTQLRESGVTILRENYGNEATKYHYKRKLVSAPDWYNAIGVADWDYEVTSIQDNLPGIHAMYGMPLLGWAAKTAQYNFAAWDFRVSNNNRWLNPHQNMTGSGAVADTTDVNPTGNIGPYNAIKDGNIYDYLEE